MARIEKRTGKKGDVSYLIRVSCGYDATGKQITKSKTWRPHPELSPRQVEKEVSAVALDFERSIRQGDVCEMSSIKLCDFCKEYLAVKEALFSPSVYLYYQTVIDQRILPTLGHMRVRDIRPLHVQHFISFLQNQPLRQDTEKHLSPASVHRYFTVLRSIMAMAYKLGYCASNPTESAKLTLPTIEEPEVAVFSESEAARMLAALETEPLMWQVLINLAVVTGARRGELCAFRWENIDLERRKVRIVGSNYRLSGSSVQTKAPKTKKSVRTVSFDDYCAHLLKLWQAEQRQQQEAAGESWKEEGWVFTRSDGGPIHPDSPTGWFRHFQHRHGIAHHKFHALRHTSGTLLLLRGTNIKTVASRLGHTQLSTVNRYVHALEEADIAAADTFNLLRQSTNKA